MKSCAACGGGFEISEVAGKFCPRCRGELETGHLPDPVAIEDVAQGDGARGPESPETPEESPEADLSS